MCVDTFSLFQWQILFVVVVVVVVVTIKKHLNSFHFSYFFVPVKNLSIVLKVAVSIILSVLNRPAIQQ